MTPVLLDTDAFTALFRGETAVLDILCRAERVFASVVVVVKGLRLWR